MDEHELIELLEVFDGMPNAAKERQEIAGQLANKTSSIHELLRSSSDPDMRVLAACVWPNSIRTSVYPLLLHCCGRSDPIRLPCTRPTQLVPPPPWRPSAHRRRYLPYELVLTWTALGTN